MEVKYGKLISRDRNGTLTEVYPEILCDEEIDFENRTSKHPVSNYAIANALDASKEEMQDKIKDAFSSGTGGLGWDDSIKKGYVDFSQMPEGEIESIVNSMVDPDGAITSNPSTGKLTVDFSKLSPEQIMALCSTTGGIIASEEEGDNHGKLAIDFSRMPSTQIESIVNSMVDPDGAIIADPTSGLLTVDFSKLSADQIMALCLAGGGITADQTTGKLKIDFSQIDPATKRSITSALKMQTPLEANLTIYVDNVNGDDTYKDYNGILIPGKGTKTSGLIPHPITESTTWEFKDSRGRTVTQQYGYPFKTMGTAVTYVSENYSLGSKNVHIRVISNTTTLTNGSKVAIPYYGSISLPALNRTSGIVYLYSTDTNNRATVMNKTTGGLFSASGSGANYELQKFDVKSVPFSTNSSTAHYVGTVSASSQAILNFVSCHFTISYAGNKHPRHFSLRPFGTSGNGSVGYYLQSGNYNSIEYDRGKDPSNLSNNVYPMFMQDSGKMVATSANSNETLELQLPLNNGDAMHQDVWDVPATTEIDEDTYQNYLADSAHGITDMQSTIIHLPVYDLSERMAMVAPLNDVEVISTEQGYGMVQGTEEAVKNFLAALKEIPADLTTNATLNDVLEMAGADRTVTVAFKSTAESLVETNSDDTPYVGNKVFTTAFGAMTFLKAHAERTLYHYMDRNSWLPAFRRVEIIPHADGAYSCTDEMAILRGTPEDLKAFFAVMAMDFKAETDATSVASYLSAAEGIYNEALAEYEAMWHAEHEGEMPVQAKILLDERVLIDELLERRNSVDKREYAYIDRFILPDEPAAGAEPTVLQQNRTQMCQDLENAGINPENEIILRGKKELLAQFVADLCSKYASIPAATLPSEIGLLKTIASTTPGSGATILDTEEAEAILLEGIQETKIVKGTITNLGALLTELKTKNNGLGTSIWKYVHCDSLYGFQCSGAGTTFLAVSSGSSFYYSAGANYNQYFIVPPRKTATGKKFTITGASVVTCNITGAFPGSTAGTVDAHSSASIPGWSDPIAFAPSIGTIMWFNLAGGSRSKIISGWLLADGGQYKQTDYPDLYAVIGDGYAGETPPSAGYFRVPNLTAELPSAAAPYIKAKG